MNRARSTYGRDFGLRPMCRWRLLVGCLVPGRPGAAEWRGGSSKETSASTGCEDRHSEGEGHGEGHCNDEHPFAPPPSRFFEQQVGIIPRCLSLGTFEKSRPWVSQVDYHRPIMGSTMFPVKVDRTAPTNRAGSHMISRQCVAPVYLSPVRTSRAAARPGGTTSIRIYCAATETFGSFAT